MKIVKISKEAVEFNNGTVLSFTPEEGSAAYADFMVLNIYTNSPKTGEPISIFDVEFHEETDKLIKSCPGEGFYLLSKTGEEFFIPCHSRQEAVSNSNTVVLSLTTDKKQVNQVEVASAETK